ncbi:Acetyltransferase (GNAT) family protein [Caprobacter fermentans]|uniref:Acetyltransferase (GNAT) family protein n=1 Tax=Caproicibacter fermentans TaxID=2576756 RepID=A0A6N8HZ50_9FIRM|nr:GNAT family N-acetyltransferase [Caproicibacter fermentans]MVB10603.1 Acetyltransferase (GNAT) family protein [Caproicibacter fermentans]
MERKENLKIRLAAQSDFSWILSLYAGATRKMRDEGIDQWDERYPDREILLQDVERGEMLLLTMDGKPVSAVVLNAEQSPEYKAVEWHIGRVDPPGVIHRLCVGAQAQGKGLGKRTLEAAERRAYSLGYRTIRLDTFTKNPAAVKLYESAGYSRAGNVTFCKGTFICFEKLLDGET